MLTISGIIEWWIPIPWKFSFDPYRPIHVKQCNIVSHAVTYESAIPNEKQASDSEVLFSFLKDD